MKRLDPSVGSSLLTLGVIVVVGLLLSIVTLVPSGTTVNTNAAGGTGGSTDGASGDSGGAGPSGGGGSGSGSGSGGTGGSAAGTSGIGGSARGVTPAAKGMECGPGKNGGATDVGVTATEVKLAATIVADGPGASFLSPVRTGMQTVVNRVNQNGGVCGRRLNLKLRNDSWDPERGKTFIQNFVESDKVFALAVVPSSEGLRNADSYIEQKGVPVIGSDGMLIHQYRNPWIWPVAVSTISTMHVMAKDAYDRAQKCKAGGGGCKDIYGIVFDAKYHFGPEGALAFNNAIKRLTGKDIDGFDPALKSCSIRFCGIQPGKPSYTSEARTFNDHCYESTRCDFVAFLLEPDTALAFLSEGRPANPQLAPDGYGMAQPLFTRSLAENCKSLCDGMWVWTGYNPPIENLANTPTVAAYVNEVKNESASADVANQFLEGGYLGMSLLVHALEKTGPNLTRNNIRAVLDSTTFDSGLSIPLTYRPNNHFANTSAQAFAIEYKQGFNGWRQKTGFIQDPWVGQDIPPGE